MVWWCKEDAIYDVGNENNCKNYGGIILVKILTKMVVSIVVVVMTKGDDVLDICKKGFWV